MESKEYFEKVMQDYNQNRNGCSLRKYCKDEAIDYNWVIEYKKNYPLQGKKQTEQPQDAFIPITIKDDTPKRKTYTGKIKHIHICGLWGVKDIETSFDPNMSSLWKGRRRDSKK